MYYYLYVNKVVMINKTSIKCVTNYMLCQVDIEYMQTLRAIRDIDQDGVTEDTFHDVSITSTYKALTKHLQGVKLIQSHLTYP